MRCPTFRPFEYVIVFGTEVLSQWACSNVTSLGKVCPDPASLAINDSLLLKFPDSRLAALGRGLVVGIFGWLAL